MPLILGVDGGGSKTHAVLVNEHGNTLGSGVSGCGNHQVSGVKVALENIRTAAETVLEEADVSPQQVTFVQYALAGADREHDLNILRPALAKLPFPDWDVVRDTMAGLRLGSPNNIGVVLVCGSGTNAMGRSGTGLTKQTGGFGYLFGDAAGGSHMAIETFRAAIRSFEYRERPSILPSLVSTYLGFNTMEQVVNHYLDRELSTVPVDLTLVLHEAAAQGDSLAIEILRSTGRELGLAANSVARRLGGWDGETFPVVLVGSVVQKARSPHLLSELERTVRMENPKAAFVIPELAPVYGAILLGMDRLGIRADEEFVQKFVSHGAREA